MSTNSQSSFTKFALIAAAVLAVALLGAWMAGIMPPSVDAAAGAIGTAERYQSQQMKDSDVQMENEDIQAFMQTAFFDQLTKDAELRKTVSKAVSDPGFQAAAATPGALALLGNANFTALLGNADFNALMGSTDLSALLGSSELAALLGSSDFAALLGNTDFAALLGDRGGNKGGNKGQDTRGTLGSNVSLSHHLALRAIGTHHSQPLPTRAFQPPRSRVHATVVRSGRARDR